MAIEVKEKNALEKVLFRDLAIGDCYRDKNKYLCIKTSVSHCIFLSTCGKFWIANPEKPEALVTPIKATLNIEE